MPNVAPTNYAIPWTGTLQVGVSGDLARQVYLNGSATWFDTGIEAVDAINVMNDFATLVPSGDPGPPIAQPTYNVNAERNFLTIFGGSSEAEHDAYVSAGNFAAYAILIPPSGTKPARGGGLSFKIAAWSGANGEYTPGIDMKATLITSQVNSPPMGKTTQLWAACLDSGVDPTYHLCFHSTATIAGLQEEIGRLLQRLDVSEPEIGDPQFLPSNNPGVPPPRGVWYRTYSLSPPAPVEKDVSLYVCPFPPTAVTKFTRQRFNSQRFLLMNEAELAAVEAEQLAVMQAEEQRVLLALSKATRDGLTYAQALNVIKFSDELLDTRVREPFATQRAAWKTKLQQAVTAAADKSNTQERKDAAWQQYKAKYPNSTVTREQFDANPAAYLLDSDLAPANGSIDKPWWQYITSGLGWLGDAGKSLLSSTDGSTLATLFGVGAAAGWFGSNLQALVVMGFAAYLLLGNGDSSTTVVVPDKKD